MSDPRRKLRPPARPHCRERDRQSTAVSPSRVAGRVAARDDESLCAVIEGCQGRGFIGNAFDHDRHARRLASAIDRSPVDARGCWRAAGVGALLDRDTQCLAAGLCRLCDVSLGCREVVGVNGVPQRSFVSSRDIGDRRARVARDHHRRRWLRPRRVRLRVRLPHESGVARISDRPRWARSAAGRRARATCRDRASGRSSAAGR